MAWGATTDSYAILRNVLEGLGYINYLMDKNKFQHAEKLVLEGKLKKKEVEKGYKADTNLHKSWYKISELASHFTGLRLANRFHTLNGKTYSRLGASLYQKKELSARMGNLLNCIMYACITLKDFFDKYHSKCATEEFQEKYKEVEDLYNSLTAIVNKPLME
jgi:hypothetical protein